jgi:hypothetical protein
VPFQLNLKCRNQFSYLVLSNQYYVGLRDQKITKKGVIKTIAIITHFILGKARLSIIILLFFPIVLDTHYKLSQSSVTRPIIDSNIQLSEWKVYTMRFLECGKESENCITLGRS